MLVRIAVATALDETESSFGICLVTRERLQIDLVVLLVVNEAVGDRDREVEPAG